MVLTRTSKMQVSVRCDGACLILTIYLQESRIKSAERQIVPELMTAGSHGVREVAFLEHSVLVA